MRPAVVLMLLTVGFVSAQPSFDVRSEFRRRIDAGQYLGPDGAEALLPLFQDPLQAADARSDLRIVLYQAGDEAIQQYLRGDTAAAPDRDTFLRCAEHFSIAISLGAPEEYRDKQYFCEARLALFDGDHAQALACFKRIKGDTLPRWALANGRGLAYLLGGKIPEAETEFRQALQANRSWAYPVNNLALALSAVGRYDDAIDILKAALNSDEFRDYVPYLHHNLGYIYASLNRTAEAEAEFRAASVLKQLWQPLNALGGIRYRQDKYNEASQLFANALELMQPDDPQRYVVLRNYATTLSRLRSGTSQAAIAWREALALRPDDPVALYGAFEANKRLRHYSEARENLERLVHLHPSEEFSRELRHLPTSNQK